MPRVLPSDVVKVINQLLPDVDAPSFAPSKQVADRVAAVLDLLDQVPDELIVLDSPTFAAYVANRAALRQLLAAWTAATDIKALAPLKGYGKNPIALIKEILAACPDQAPTVATSELLFIKDPQLQKSLRLDLSEANRAVVSSEFKAAAVLAGSVLEALLLYAIEEHEKKTPGAIATACAALGTAGIFTANPGGDPTARTWSLHHYTEVAGQLKIIKEASVKQARLAKDYRDLIHPARAVRLQQSIHRGTALGAMSAVEFVINDLS
jgi:hypothetical protein